MKFYEPFKKFASGQLAIGDTDPHVQVMTHVTDALSLSREERLWYGLLYMAYYQDGSALLSLSDPETRARKKLPRVDLPISYQRRNLYGGRILTHFESVYEVPLLEEYLDVQTWSALIIKLKAIYGNGRWASYTTAELLCKLVLTDIKPDTSEMVDSSGPKAGMAFLGVADATDGDVLSLQRRLTDDGVSGADDLEKLESVLCNWSRMCKGDFYLGHNLDRQHDRIRRVEREYGADMTLLWTARRAVFDHAFLAEVTLAWPGVDKDRKKTYSRTGVVLGPTEDR